MNATSVGQSYIVLSIAQLTNTALELHNQRISPTGVVPRDLTIIRVFETHRACITVYFSMLCSACITKENSVICLKMYEVAI